MLMRGARSSCTCDLSCLRATSTLLLLRVTTTAKNRIVAREEVMTTVSFSGTTPVTATSKLWFLTFNPGSKDVLVWKNGLRKSVDPVGRSV